MDVVAVDMKATSVKDAEDMCRSLLRRGVSFSYNANTLTITVMVPSSVITGG